MPYDGPREKDKMSIFDSIIETVGSVEPQEFMISIGAALLAGLILSALYMFRNRHSGSFAVTVVCLPAIVSAIIMAVSGSIGAGIAVAGAFSLVRFRSAPGSAKEIAVLFLAMASGLLCGMGLVAYGLLFAVIVGMVFFVLTAVNFGETKANSADRILRIVIPEDVDYGTEIDPVIEEYTSEHQLISVRSSNMGTMYKLKYKVRMNDIDQQKELIDRIRVRNGNLEVAVMVEDTEQQGL